MKEKKIFIPIYNFEIVLICGDHVDIVESLNKRHDGLDVTDYVGGSGNHFAVKDNNLKKHIDYLILYGTPEVSTIYHESLHIAWEILKSRFVQVSYDNQESLAYLIDYIAEEVLETLKQWNDG